MIRTFLRCVLLTVLLWPQRPLWSQSREFDITPVSEWVDTGIDLTTGDTLHITATGQLQYASAKEANGPAGLSRSFTDLLRTLPVNEAGRGALVGRIGSSAATRAFLVGEQLNYQAPIAGRLFLSINQSSMDQASGTYHVTVDRTAAKATTHADAHVPAFPQSLIDSIPRRVSDPQGNPGDRVNFILIGSQDQVQSALKAAGWVVVDKTNQDAVVRGIFASL